MALAMAAVSALATACNGGDDSPNFEANGGSCAPGVTDDEIKVGILYPDTGMMSVQFTGYRAGVEARLAEENAAGGVGGRQISTIWRDDESDPSVNLRAAEELVRHDAFAILEYTAFSPGSSAWLHEQGVPVVGVADQSNWGDYDNMFTYTYGNDPDSTATTLGDFVRSRGGTKAALVVSLFTEAARLHARGAAQSLTTAGVEIVYQDEIDGVNTNKVVTDVVRSGADRIIAAAPLDLYTGVLSAAQAQGQPFKAAVSTVSYDVRLLGPPVGPALAGTYAQLTFAALERDLPAHRAFLAAMARHAPEIDPPSQQSAITGWISADLFIRGLRTQQGCPTRESYINGLRGVTDYDADGFMVQKVNFATDQGQVDRCSDFVQVNRDGTAFEVADPQPRCGERVTAPPTPAAGTASAGAPAATG